MNQMISGWLRLQLTPRGLATLAIGVGRAVWGAVCVLVPGPLVRVVGGTPADEGARVALRVLGARHVVQALLSCLTPGPGLLRVGAGVDALHALSLAALAVVDRRWARVALADAVVAGAWGLLTWGSARIAPGGPRGRRERVVGAVLQRLPLPAL